MSSKTRICSFLSCCLSCISRAHLATICLWTAAILCTTSFFSNSWRVIKATKAIVGSTAPDKYYGLLSYCCTLDGRNTWIWTNFVYLYFELQEWQRVMQSLLLVGILLLLPVLIMSPFRFCSKCGRMSVRLSAMSAVLTTLSACLFGSAEIYFFYKVIGDYKGATDTIGRINSWSWAFKVCGVGTCFSFASSFFWFLDSKREVDYVSFQDQNELRLERR